MASTRTGPGPSVVLLIVVAVALAVGAAASLVAGAASAPAFHSGPASELLVSPAVIGALIVLLLAVAVGVGLYVRISSGTMRMPGRFAVTVLAAILVGVLFVALLHSGAGAGGSGFAGGGNSTGSGGSTNGTSGSNVTGAGGELSFLSVKLPSWALFVAVAAIVLVVGAVAVPRAWAYAIDRERERGTGRPRSPETEAVRGALAAAAQQLEEGGEPREVIVALYATVLARVGPMVGGVEVDTPEEIRSLHLVRLGIRAAAAETLTRLFEKARYSSHPMNPDAAQRARVAIREARDDLDRVDRAAPPA